MDIGFGCMPISYMAPRPEDEIPLAPEKRRIG